MYEMFFRTNEEAGSLYDLEDMLKVSLHGDDLKSFMYNWDAVVAGMKHIPDEHTMRDLFFRQIKKSNRMRYDIDTYERAKEGDPKHTYAFLEKSVRMRKSQGQSRPDCEVNHIKVWHASAGILWEENAIKKSKPER